MSPAVLLSQTYCHEEVPHQAQHLASQEPHDRAFSAGATAGVFLQLRLCGGPGRQDEAPAKTGCSLVQLLETETEGVCV